MIVSAQMERTLLRLLRTVVPAAGRDEWTRTWQAELWHLHHTPRHRRQSLTFGLLCDAFWLRADACRRSLEGTALLCVLALAACCLCAAVIGFGLTGNLRDLAKQATLFAWQAPLIVFVTFATASRRHVQHSVSLRPIHRIRRQLFFGLKAFLVLALGFLLSADLAPFSHTSLPFASDLVQTFTAVVFSIVGLRWAMLDQQQRCKQCLVLLTSPARIGRPSHNLLEWNGTEQLCRHGHGVLSSPELETSWCNHSRWRDAQPVQVPC